MKRNISTRLDDIIRFLVIILSPVNLAVKTIANDYPRNAAIVNLTEGLRKQGVRTSKFVLYFLSVFFLFFFFLPPSILVLNRV